MAVFGGPTFCLVTGASKGIGRGIAIQIAQKMGDDSLLVLVARSEQGLRETMEFILEKRSSGIDIRVVPCDLGDLGNLKKAMAGFFSGVDTSKFQHSMLVHNVGSVGDVSKTLSQMHDPEETQAVFGLNVTSAVCLTSKFMEVFPKTDGHRRSVVNISSDNAVIPYAYMSLYSAAKAARYMLFRVLALEAPDVRVLNYAPGAVDTEMLTYVKENAGDPGLRKLLRDFRAEGQELTPEKTCETLINILEEDSYESGCHIDIYDLMKDRDNVSA